MRGGGTLSEKSDRSAKSALGALINLPSDISDLSDLSDKARDSLYIGEELGEYFIEGLFGLVLFEVEGLPVGDVEVFSSL